MDNGTVMGDQGRSFRRKLQICRIIGKRTEREKNIKRDGGWGEGEAGGDEGAARRLHASLMPVLFSEVVLCD